MTNYNDGNWHGWNGGECPVHPETEVEAIFSNSFGDLLRDTRLASSHMWNPADMPKAVTFAFRVVKEHREPREWWAFCDHLYATEAAADEFRAKLIEKRPAYRYETMPIIHVREALQ